MLARDVDGLPVDLVRRAQLAHEAIGHCAGPGQVGLVHGEDGELVTPEAGHEVISADETRDPFRDCDEEGVPVA